MWYKLICYFSYAKCYGLNVMIIGVLLQSVLLQCDKLSLLYHVE